MIYKNILNMSFTIYDNFIIEKLYFLTLFTIINHESIIRQIDEIFYI